MIKYCFNLIILLSQCCFPLNKDSLDDLNFQEAIKSHSTSSRLVLVTIINKNDKTKRTYCVYAESFILSLCYEHSLGENSKGRLIAEKMAIEYRDSIFNLKNKKALELLKCKYDEKTLNNMRKIFGNKSDAELKAIFLTDLQSNLFFHELYSKNDKYLSNTFAVAHILLERGFWPYIGCEDQLLHIK